MTNAAYDAIVLGVGGMGAATLFELARRGHRVLGLEQFSLGHVLGSSHGRSRIIRQAYYEHPAYVPLVRRAYEGWYDLEVRAGRRLLTECPCLSLGSPDSSLVRGVRASAAQHGLAVEDLDARAVRQRFRAFRVPDGMVGVVEGSAGILAVDEGVREHLAAARALGAQVREEAVVDWSATGSEVRVQTDKDTWSAARLIVTAGPWAGRLLRGRVPLTVMRQVAFWFRAAPTRPEDDEDFRRDRFPVFIADTADGYFYGIPMLDGDGVKVARHYGAAELPGPEAVERAVTEADEAPVAAFLRAFLPSARVPSRQSSVCLYTLTPDRHFVLDRHPEHANVFVAAGFSGHGYKFAPIVGAILADLAEDRKPCCPIELFRIDRFGTTDSLQ